MRPHETSPAALTSGRIAHFWLPLEATWLMMAAEGPFVAALIARLAAPEVNLAAFAVATALAWIVESPIIMMLSASNALVRDGVAYRKLRRFSNLLNAAVTAGNGTTDPIDNFNLGLNKGRSDFDRAHVFNLQSSYTLPIGHGHAFGGNMPRWANTLVGGWDLGGLMIWESGSAITAGSGRYTNVSYNSASWLNVTGSRDIGGLKRTVANYDGVYFFDPNTYFSQFTYPGMADYGNAGRNTYRGPRFFNVDASLVKTFALTERKRVLFRAEAYNLFNNVNFGNPSFSLTNASTFGKISGVVSNPRLLQAALRFEW